MRSRTHLALSTTATRRPGCQIKAPSSSNRLLTLEAPKYRSLYSFRSHNMTMAAPLLRAYRCPHLGGLRKPRKRALTPAPLFGVHGVCSRAADPPTVVAATFSKHSTRDIFLR